MGNLKNKVALVTGAAEGLGKAIAIGLANEGAKVIITDINEDLLRKTSKELKDDFCDIDYVAGDISNKDNVNTILNFVIQRYSKIDILINNAGGSLHTPRNIDEITEEDWDKVLNVNLKGTFFLSQAAVKHMKKNQEGKIINIASIGGRTASLITGVAYAAAKGGVISFTRRLASEVGEHGINVNAVAPGVIISGKRVQKLFYEQNTDQDREKLLNEIPLRKMGEINDITNATLFLASEKSKYMTGTVLDVNGGRFMG